MNEEEKLKNAVKDALVTLEVISRTGHVSQGGEQRGNWDDVTDVYEKLRRSLEAFEAIR